MSSKPRITRLGAVVSFCLITVVLILVFINSKPIIGEYISTGGLSIYKVLGKVLNEYMVPFEFASVLLLVAMIGTVLLSKKKKQINNNILNENRKLHFPFYDTFFVLGSLAYRRNAIIVFMSEIMLNAVNLCLLHFHQDAQGQIFVFSLWLLLPKLP
jgi:preprotein translocase subunit SecG